MAKFVCDFEAVREAGEKLITTASDMDASIKEYDTNIQSDLEGWEGASKNSFGVAHTGQIVNAVAVNELADRLGRYVKTVADKIEQLENELSNIEI